MRKDKGTKDPLDALVSDSEILVGLKGLETKQPRKTRKGRKKDPMSDLFGRGIDVFGIGKQFDPFK